MFYLLQYFYKWSIWDWPIKVPHKTSNKRRIGLQLHSMNYKKGKFLWRIYQLKIYHNV